MQVKCGLWSFVLFRVVVARMADFISIFSLLLSRFYAPLIPWHLFCVVPLSSFPSSRFSRFFVRVSAWGMQRIYCATKEKKSSFFLRILHCGIVVLATLLVLASAGTRLFSPTTPSLPKKKNLFLSTLLFPRFFKYLDAWMRNISINI